LGESDDHGAAPPQWPPHPETPAVSPAEALVRARGYTEQAVAHLEAQFEAQFGSRLDARLEAVETEIEARLDALLDARLEAVEAQFEAHVGARLAALEALEATSQRQTAEAIAALAVRLDAFESRWASEQERITDLTVLATSVTDLFSTLERLDARCDDRIGEVRAELTTIRAQLDHVQPLRERAAKVTRDLADLREEFDGHRTVLDGRVEDVVRRVGEVETAVGDDGVAEIAAHLDRVEELERAIAELDPDRFATRDELARLVAGRSADHQAAA
jgi:chromosome segregation ATPase